MEVNRITETGTDNTAPSAVNAASDSDFSNYLDSDSNTLEAIFNEASEAYGVSVSLLEAIGKQESGFDPNATSRCGAQGIMQLMPATAAGLGVSDSYDARQNIMGGAKYVASLLQKYDGNVSFALAAYNAGSNNVAKYGGIPPFKETQNYVEKVLGYMESGVTLPDGTVTSGNSSAASGFSDDPSAPSTSSDQADLKSLTDLLFTYEEYLKFLDIYMDSISSTQKAANEKQQEETANGEKTSGVSDNYYAYQNIRFNNSIMNLLNGTDV